MSLITMFRSLINILYRNNWLSEQIYLKLFLEMIQVEL